MEKDNLTSQLSDITDSIWSHLSDDLEWGCQKHTDHENVERG